MPRLKNISGTDRHVGRADGPVVKSGDVLAVEGDLLADLDDAYVTGTKGDDEVFDPDTEERAGFTGEARAWPKETWELLQETRPAKAGTQSEE